MNFAGTKGVENGERVLMFLLLAHRFSTASTPVSQIGSVCTCRLIVAKRVGVRLLRR